MRQGRYASCGIIRRPGNEKRDIARTNEKDKRFANNHSKNCLMGRNAASQVGRKCWRDGKLISYLYAIRDTDEVEVLSTSII